MKLAFNIYVAISYVGLAFIQNMAKTDKYGFSIATVTLVMFLFVAYVWIKEVFQSENDYSFSNLKWKYSWMIFLSVFTYICFIDGDYIDYNPLHFFMKDSATKFCLITPLFLTIMTLNIPKINIVTYRITAIMGVIVSFYYILSDLCVSSFYFILSDLCLYGLFQELLNISLLAVSLSCAIVSYKIKKE